jgi:hypothetical protein
VFSPLGRKDRRAAAGLYARGLMLDGRRKSMQPMAQRLRVNHQRLQHFVTSSPWDVEPIRKTLSHKACALIEPDAWVIDDTGLFCWEVLRPEDIRLLFVDFRSGVTLQVSGTATVRWDDTAASDDAHTARRVDFTLRHVIAMAPRRY